MRNVFERLYETKDCNFNRERRNTILLGVVAGSICVIATILKYLFS